MTLNISSVEHQSGDNLTAGNLNAPHDQIVSYINNLQTVEYVTSNLTKTVGSGGDFATLQAAVDYFGTLIPNATSVVGTIMLKSGFVLEEGVVMRSKNLGWVEIKSEDNEVLVDPTKAYNPASPADNRTFSILGSLSVMPNIYVNLKAQSHNIRAYKVIGAFNNSSLHIGGPNAALGYPTGGSIRNQTTADFTQSIEIASSYCYALQGVFDAVLLNINSTMMFRDGKAKRLYLRSFSYVEVSGATDLSGGPITNVLNVPLNTFSPYGIAFDPNA